MIRLLTIRGQSLAPEYQDGDFVVVSKIPVCFHRLRPGDVVAFRHPVYGTMIKKIESISADHRAFHVTGTHPWSVDSREFGPVDRAAIIGKVILHISTP